MNNIFFDPIAMILFKPMLVNPNCECRKLKPGVKIVKNMKLSEDMLFPRGSEFIDVCLN